jgi:cytochrome c oxidase subunit IV
MEHIIPIRTYLIIWIALMVLMVITAALSFVNLGDWNTPIALLIGGIKATLVILWFMHVKFEQYKITWVFIIAGLFWLGFLFVLSLSDYLSRGWAGVAGH